MSGVIAAFALIALPATTASAADPKPKTEAELCAGMHRLVTPGTDLCTRGPDNIPGTGLYKIVDSNSGKAVRVTGCSTADTATVDLRPYEGLSCEQWRIEALSNNAYKIIGLGSGKSLDVAGCNPAAGADVIIWPFHGGSCQRWYFDAL